MILRLNNSVPRTMSLRRKSIRTRFHSNRATRLYFIPTICPASLHLMMAFGEGSLSFLSMPKLREIATSRTMVSIFMTMPAVAFWRGSSRVRGRSSSRITKFLCPNVCKMPLMNIAAKTIGSVTFFRINVRLIHPIKKTLPLFIKPTDSIPLIAMNMCAVRLISTLHWKRQALSALPSREGAILRACACVKIRV